MTTDKEACWSNLVAPGMHASACATATGAVRLGSTEAGFTEIEHTMEIFGLCAGCGSERD